MFVVHDLLILVLISHVRHGKGNEEGEVISDEDFGTNLVASMRNDANLDLSVDEEYEDLRAELLAYHTALASIASSSKRRSMVSTPCWGLGGICVDHRLCTGFRYLTQVPGCKDKLMVCCFAWNKYKVRDWRHKDLGLIAMPWSLQHEFGGVGIIDTINEEIGENGETKLKKLKNVKKRKKDKKGKIGKKSKKGKKNKNKKLSKVQKKLNKTQKAKKENEQKFNNVFLNAMLPSNGKEIGAENQDYLETLNDNLYNAENSEKSNETMSSKENTSTSEDEFYKADYQSEESDNQYNNKVKEEVDEVENIDKTEEKLENLDEKYENNQHFNIPRNRLKTNKTRAVAFILRPNK